MHTYSIETTQRICRLVMEEMIAYFEGDIKRINHFIKVYEYANIILSDEDLIGKEAFIVKNAALMHDIGIKNSEIKYNTSIGKYQEKEGPPEAKLIMEKLDFKEDVIERICYLVGNHHSYHKVNGIDFQILIEADFIVNIEEDRIQKDEVLIMSNKYFKTKKGRELLKILYLAP